MGKVKERLAEIRASLPEGVEIRPFYDRADFVGQVLHTVRMNLLEGGVIVAIVLLLVLGSWRAGLLVASIIPLSMLGAFALMYYSGLSGNLLSPGAIDFGMVVDGAVVLVEGMVAAMGAHSLTAKQAIGRVASEVGRPVTMTVVIIGIVYVPILLLVGVEGKMFRPMALSVLFAMLMALILTFTWIPAAGAAFLKNIPEHEPRFVEWIRDRYVPAVRWLSSRLGPVLIAMALAIGFGVACAITRGAEFVPRLEEGALAIQVTRPPSVSLEEAARGTLDIERALQKFPEVARVVSRTGSPDVATDIMGVEQSDVIVMLKPRSEWVTGHDTASFAEVFQPLLRRTLPGAVFGFTQPIEMRVQELIGGVRSDVGVKIYGNDLATLRRLGEELSGVINATRGSAHVRIDMQPGLRMIDTRPEPRLTARLGIDTPSILAFAELMRSGRTVGTLREAARSFDVALVRVPRAQRPFGNVHTPSPRPRRIDCE